VAFVGSIEMHRATSSRLFMISLIEVATAMPSQLGTLFRFAYMDASVLQSPQEVSGGAHTMQMAEMGL